MNLALRQSAYIKGGLINDFQLKLTSQFFLTLMMISHFPKSPSEKGGQAQSTQFQHTDVSGRVGLTGPLEQLTLSSHSILVTSAPLTSWNPRPRVTAHSLRPVYLSSS